jgi:hypothetical protein
MTTTLLHTVTTLHPTGTDTAFSPQPITRR